jgi:2-octaprenylphenol hydroxylase
MADDLLDVLIVGGGPVGACAAALLQRSREGGSAPPRVAVLEPRTPEPPAQGSAPDARVVAVSRASERILAHAGAWSRISGPRLLAYERMRIWHEGVGPRSAGALVFDAADAGEPNLGYILESRLLTHALLQSFLSAGGRIEPAQLRALHITAASVTVETSASTLAARLVIGADGSESAVRKAVGLTADVASYQQTAIVANVATERPHENTAWQRFMHDGTLAFLPLAAGTSSIVWSADDGRAQALLEASDVDFAGQLDRASDEVLGVTRLVSERLSFPLRRLSTHHRIAQRVALIGDAAHVIHPLAGQGVNLGLLDAAALTQTILKARQQGEDPGALRCLRSYERWRKSEVLAMTTMIDAFDRYLAHGKGPASHLARTGLGWVNRSPEVKRFFIRRALGLAGELPDVAHVPLSPG